MKLLKHILLLSLVFALLACNKDSDHEPPKPCAQTVIVFMPWADMTTYFKRNISDFENFVNTGNLDNQRVIGGTIAVTDCRRLDDLAQTVRKINLSQEFDEAALSSTQKMDGYNPTVFYDFGDYFLHQCTDEDLSAELLLQLEAAVPYKAHTECYFSAVNGSHKTIIIPASPSPPRRMFSYGLG